MDIIVAKIKTSFCIIVFGTMGIVAHFIPLTPAGIIFYRAVAAGVFLLGVAYVRKQPIGWSKILKKWPLMLGSGVCMGLCWMFIFTAYTKTSVSVASVCFNMHPITFILLSVLLLKEKVPKQTYICMLVAVVGIVLATDVINIGVKSQEVIGMVFALLSAIFYNLVTIINKIDNTVRTRDKLFCQFVTAAIMVIPYIYIIEKSSLAMPLDFSDSKTIVGIVALLVLGFFHTGYIYVIFFDSIKLLNAQTIALYGYLEPMTTLILSHLILHETLTPLQIVGAILIMVATLANELLTAKLIMKKDKTGLQQAV